MSPTSFPLTTHPPEIQHAPPGKFASHAMYVGADDSLRVVAINRLSGLSIVITARVLLANGQIVPSQWVLRPTSDRVVNTNTLDLPEGYLLSLSAETETTGALPGVCWLAAALARGNSSTAAAFIGGQLLQGYVGLSQPLAWPPFAPSSQFNRNVTTRAITGTDPAAGVEISETVPTGAAWELISLFTSLVTSATAANRRPVLRIDDGSTVFFRGHQNNTISASTTSELVWFVGGVMLSGAATSGLPHNLLLLPGWRVTTLTESFQVDDNYAAPGFVVREFLVG